MSSFSPGALAGLVANSAAVINGSRAEAGGSDNLGSFQAVASETDMTQTAPLLPQQLLRQLLEVVPNVQSSPGAAGGD